jgi:hypothetical protein
MRSRDKILANLDQIYRESYEQARDAGQASRMADLDNAYMRDQLMLEILLDIRELFAVAPAANDQGKSALERLEALRKLVRR